MRFSKYAFFAVCAAVALVAPSCANQSTTPTDGGTDAQVGPCGPGTAVKCGDTCVDPQSNGDNCGSCGNACAAGLVCSHGNCATICASGTTHCGGNNCIDTKVDVNNCGGCGQKCPSGNVCSNGSCALTCQTGLTDCNGDCVDVNQNDDNCGACAAPCAGGQVCSNGKCIATCQAGWTSCSVGDAGATTCVDTQHDKSHCGSCGNACPSGEFCSPQQGIGTCGIGCFGGTTLCNQACVDESIDPNNCGGCAQACSGNCSAGHCCAANQIYCGSCDTPQNCITKSTGRIAAGYTHTCAIDSLGVLKCWGDDFDGELGDGKNSTSSNTPIQVALSNVSFISAGTSLSCAVAGGKAYCWGYGFEGQIGDGGATERDSPTLVSSLTSTVTRIDAGGEQACALLSANPAVECWGYNFYGEVGDNSTTERDTPVATSPAITAALDINTGIGDTSCALLTDNTVECWGENDYGECGDNSTTNRQQPVPVQNLTNVAGLGLGYVHSCAVLTNGQVWCWGDDQFGELGDKGTTQSAVPVQAQGVSGALAVAAGGDGFSYAHTCALLQSSAVVCWGSNDFGQLGDGTTTNSSTPVTAISSGAVAIAAGFGHTCALMSDGHAKCWGYNGDGELGDGTNNDSHVPVLVQGF